MPPEFPRKTRKTPQFWLACRSRGAPWVSLGFPFRYQLAIQSVLAVACGLLRGPPPCYRELEH